ncbi:acyl-CoA oxidase [Marinitenerispora sediminis]|uniref:Acyl-CoA oxidase n=2 Tax=Marinitenerispora sediminis TaxID=1931232 RepID=A0A368SZ49_9ACTN|nr:acyl-CoA oxidase [Marinitenerispora sediminis]RCV48468.1 acyl-CoA oxidase [Marinitenerispora sediminis]RCV50279.1 acyl-CoA oxidase [Marinitenerispora sediminis]
MREPHFRDEPTEDPRRAPGSPVAPTTVPGLKRVLFGPTAEYDREHRPWRALLATEPFRARAVPDGADRVALSYQRLHLLNDDLDSALELAADPARLASLHEWTAPVDSGLTTIAGIHYNLFLGSLLDHDRQPGRELGDYLALRRVGTFLCTELDHGNDAGALRTTATYDPAADGFVLHTPDPGARKFMPNTGGYGGPKTGLVAARLVVDGDDHGVFLFLTPLTDASGPLPGVTVRPLTEKYGSPVDHCLTSFEHVRLPRHAMLAGEHGRLGADGVLTSAVGNRRRRFLRSIDRVTTGKLCMSAATLGAVRAALAIAVRYSHHRGISGARGGTRVPVFAHRSHHGPLVSALAASYAMTLLHRETVRMFRVRPADARGRERAERMAAVAKGWVTWNGRRILIECRERCGARALFPANRLATLCADSEGPITAEGDNLAVWVKAGAEMLLDHDSAPPSDAPAGRPLTDPGFLGDLLASVERVHLHRARRRLRQAPPGDPLGRWNAAAPHALRAVAAFAQRRAGEALLGAARTAEPDTGPLLLDLYRLFALERIGEHAGDLLAEGRLTGDQTTALPDAVEELIASLAGQALTLVEAFDLPEEVLADVPIAGPRIHAGLVASDTRPPRRFPLDVPRAERPAALTR